MYLSPVVRTLRDDPVPDTDVTLLLTIADDSSASAVETIEETVNGVDGSVDDHLQFDTLAVTVPQSEIAALCELDGVAAIETENAIGITPGDAEEDLDP
ncbi:MAG: hypothetical protein ABEI77_01980 [Halorientalis sp.]